MSLKAEVFVCPPIDINPAVTLPITGQVRWSPISITLIYGEREAILVDTPITLQQNEIVVEWVKAILGDSRSLTTIYITHGHPDHFMGIGVFKKHFPDCKAVATLGTISHMKDELDPNKFDATWRRYFPTELPDVEIAEPLTTKTIFLENHALEILELGHTDTYASSALWVSDIGLVVCGDAVYGEVHQMLREANTPHKRQEWINAVEKIKALHPKRIVAGHKRPDDDESVPFLDKTIEYIRDFGTFVESTKTAKELFDRMMEKYGGRQNPAALEIGCHAAHPPES